MHSTKDGKECRKLKVDGSGDMVIFHFSIFQNMGKFLYLSKHGFFFPFCTLKFSNFFVFLNNE